MKLPSKDQFRNAVHAYCDARVGANDRSNSLDSRAAFESLRFERGEEVQAMVEAIYAELEDQFKREQAWMIESLIHELRLAGPNMTISLPEGSEYLQWTLLDGPPLSFTTLGRTKSTGEKE